MPVSIIGTFGAMYLLGYSLDNLSLMALTVSTGFVVDDAIVVLENISRHLEDGMPRMQAALQGAREVGFTVISISLSLIAVFLPILLMGGIVGRLFREFAMTLSLAILISLVISLTTTPMMCALFLRPRRRGDAPARRCSTASLDWYGRTPGVALRHPRAGHAGAAGDRRAERLALCHHAQGIFPAAGHRPPDWQPAGGPEHFVPGACRRS